MKGKGKIGHLFMVLSSVTLLSAGSVTVNASIMTTKHNLSTSGPGPVKATTENRVCVFCHTPHGAAAVPLWNHSLSTVSYTVPSNTMAEWSSMLSTPENPPDGDSRLCLSCHDGTVALGAVVNLGGAPTTISMQGTEGGKFPSSSTAYFGTDLSGHHPVSIEVNQALLNDKDAQCSNNLVGMRICTPQHPVKLRPTANMYIKGPHTGVGVQCSTCHDAHDNSNGSFLRVAGGMDICNNCHITCSESCP